MWQTRYKLAIITHEFYSFNKWALSPLFVCGYMYRQNQALLDLLEPEVVQSVTNYWALRLHKMAWLDITSLY